MVLRLRLHLARNGAERSVKRNKSWENIYIFGFEEGRSATEISSSIRLMAEAARECGPEPGIISCSMDVKQAFDKVSPLHLSMVMKEMNIAPVLAGAILREQIGDKYDHMLPRDEDL